MIWHRGRARDGQRSRRGSTVTLLGLSLIGVVGAGIGLTGCGSSGTSTNAITLYNGQHEQTTDSLVAAFEKETGITVNVRSDDEDTLADQIVAEGA
ncbi:MAG TPA: hypothetical protein VED63_07220, partial [Acidimicrobiales bacterium]|nr:hypothetical protein [Acidimicrobiales bacterium]